MCFSPYWKVFSRWAAVGHLARERQRYFLEQKRKTSDWCSSLWQQAAQRLRGRRFWSRRRHSSKNSLLCVRPTDKQAQTALTVIYSNMCVSVSYNWNQMAGVCVCVCRCDLTNSKSMTEPGKWRISKKYCWMIGFALLEGSIWMASAVNKHLKTLRFTESGLFLGFQRLGSVWTDFIKLNG